MTHRSATGGGRSLVRGIRNPTLREAVRACITAGWTPKRTGSGHLTLLGPDGRARVSLSMTAGEHARAAANVIAALRRAGAPV